MTISFFDKVRLKDEQIVEKYTTITLKKYDISDLNEVIDEIKKLGEEEYYINLLRTNLRYGWFIDNETASHDLKCEIVDNGREFLGYQPINLPPFTRVIAYQDLQSFYNFLIGIYVTGIGKQLGSEEIGRLCNNIEVRIMKNLDKFDQISEKPLITEEYFKKLHKIKWGKKSRGLWLDLNGLRKFAGHPEKTPLRFLIEHDLLTQFLAACNAVNNDRYKIEQEDVVAAYKTYFKLLKTDLPALIEKLG